MAVINERLDTASVFLQPDNSVPLESLIKSLKQIKNMKTVLIHLRKGISNGANKSGGIKNGVWASLRTVSLHEITSLQRDFVNCISKFAFHALRIRDAFDEVAGAGALAIRTKVSLLAPAGCDLLTRRLFRFSRDSKRANLQTLVE